MAGINNNCAGFKEWIEEERFQHMFANRPGDRQHTIIYFGLGDESFCFHTTFLRLLKKCTLFKGKNCILISDCKIDKVGHIYPGDAAPHESISYITIGERESVAHHSFENQSLVPLSYRPRQDGLADMEPISISKVEALSNALSSVEIAEFSGSLVNMLIHVPF